MDKFLQDLSSAYWWTTVVVVGVAINIGSSYLRRLLESQLSTVSSFWRRRRERRSERLTKGLDLLRASPELRAMLAQSEVRLRIRAISFEIEGVAVASGALLLSSRGTDYSGIVSALMTAALFLLLMGLDDLRLSISAGRKLATVLPELRQVVDA